MVHVVGEKTFTNYEEALVYEKSLKEAEENEQKRVEELLQESLILAKVVSRKEDKIAYYAIGLGQGICTNDLPKDIIMQAHIEGAAGSQYIICGAAGLTLRCQKEYDILNVTSEERCLIEEMLSDYLTHAPESRHFGLRGCVEREGVHYSFTFCDYFSSDVTSKGYVINQVDVLKRCQTLIEKLSTLSVEEVA